MTNLDYLKHMIETLIPVTDADLETFRADLEASLKRARANSVLADLKIDLEMGRKNCRVVLKEHGNHLGSAFCFVRLADGAILKAAGYKAPAKHARGNIRVGNAANWWNDALTEFGASYL